MNPELLIQPFYRPEQSWVLRSSWNCPDGLFYDIKTREMFLLTSYPYVKYIGILPEDALLVADVLAGT